MYSFGPLPKYKKSGRVVGAHQKIDRVARRHLQQVLPRPVIFPSIRAILHFEGINGPDGIKLKSPGKDEPWHFINPNDPDDSRLLLDIRHHSENLTTALSNNDTVRAAFEAAWLAHAVTDGLTPAHHVEYDKKVEHLSGEHAMTRTSIRQKVVMSGGGSAKQFVKNNWEYWGAGGLMTSHTLFEAGVATTIKPLQFDAAKPSSNDLIRVRQEGFEVLFLEAVAKVHHLGMYEDFLRTGWTRRLAQKTRSELVPTIIRLVTLSWYAASIQAQERKQRRG